ncbi:MAG: DUF1638 domain-containing protein [Anaerolineae bacterium]|nr:DUF1638 domain-containing protein [Anaerolineae bacterium]
MIKHQRAKIIACATVIEEMLPLIPDGMAYEVLDYGLHLRPANLKQALQEAIDKAGQEADTVILGYGLCSMAVVGLVATRCTLVVPRVDDCIAIFLGSGTAYLEQVHQEPGTYYLTKGWIEVSDTLLDEYNRAAEKYGEEKAMRMMGIMLKNYKRLVYIDTGVMDQARYKAYAHRVADQFSLRYEVISGSNALIKKMLFGPWDADFVVVSPGQTITYADFNPAARASSSISHSPGSIAHA